MQFRAFSFAIVFLSFGLLASSSPVEAQLGGRDMEKRAVDIVEVSATLLTDITAHANSFIADPVTSINSFATAFDEASNSLKGVGIASLSSADQQAVAKNVAGAINVAATAIGTTQQTAGVVDASVMLDGTVNVFLNVLGLIVVNIDSIIAPMMNVQGLVSSHMGTVANIFINLLGTIIIL